MEVEYKYLIDDPALVDEIFADELVRSLADGEEEIIPMHGVFLDTEDLRLMEDKIALRVRDEGGSWVCTVKWGGGADEEGLHRRQEVNVPVKGPSEVSESLACLSQCQIYERLMELTKDRPLVELFTMDFIRRQVRLDTGKSISILSVDQGKVRAKQEEEPILELEVELFSGEEEDMRAVCEEISRKYALIPGRITKFQRGKALFNR